MVAQILSFVGILHPTRMKYLYAYQNIAVPANIVTITCCYEAWRNDSLTAVGILVWLKLFTTLILITYIHLFRANVVFFFMNLGFGRMSFYLTMLIMDTAFFMALIFLVA